MKCKFCDGSGKDYWCLNGVPYPCPVCNGTGEIKDKPQTNEEWRRTCSTEEFAKWLEDKMTWAAQEQGTFTAKGWEMWLKQPHRNKE